MQPKPASLQRLVTSFVDADRAALAAVAADARRPREAAWAAALGSHLRHTPGQTALIRRALDDPPDDPELFVALLHCAAWAAYRAVDQAEVEAAARQAGFEQARRLRPEIRYCALRSRLLLAYLRHDRDTQQALLGECAALRLPVGSRMRMQSLEDRFAFAEGQLDAHSIRTIADQMVRDPSLTRWFGASAAAVLRARACLVEGRAEAGLEALAQLPDDRPQWWVHPLRARLAIIGGRMELAEAAVAAATEWARDRDGARAELGLLPIDLALLRGQLVLGMRRLIDARRHLRDALEASAPGQAVPDELLVLRAHIELAGGRAAAAREALDGCRSISPEALGTEWARLRALEGQAKDAASRLRAAIDRDGEEAVQARLRCAYELAPGAIAALWRDAAGAKAAAPRHEERQGDSADDEPELVGQDPAIVAVRGQLRRFAALDAPVLIEGETGTGKEIAAQLLHRSGPRRRHPFVAVNCAAVSDTLVESELFGHTRGAFTGATIDSDGLLLSAGQGTVFLDEITAMSPRMQAALLRTLETGEVRAVGGSEPRRMRARIVAAANRSLEDEVARGAFRADLYYRLQRLEVRLPPLRDRRDDIPLLARHLLQRAHPGKSLAPELLAELRRRPFPGNVRELRNLVERAVLLADGDAVSVAPPLAERSGVQAPMTAQPSVVAGGYRGGRLARLRALFAARHRLTRAEAATLLGCAPNTVSEDLAALVRDGEIVRRVPNGVRSLYFERRGSAIAG